MNSFRSSGKRHLILTGKRGSGKTTLLSELFDEKTAGIITFAEKGRAVWLEDKLSGERAVIGSFDVSSEGSEKRMIPQTEGFLTLGVSALRRCAESESQWVTVDEIGYLEAHCEQYKNALLELFSEKQVCAVVRKDGSDFLRSITEREDAFVVDLDDPFGSIGCVIMASGMGRRFGGNKLMADFSSEPMISRILSATEGIFSQRVVVTRHKEIDQLCRKQGIRTVLHSLPHRNDTVRLGLEALEGVDRCLFAPADQPLLTRKTVAAAALCSKNAPDYLWRTSCGESEGMPAVFPKALFSELMKLTEGKGGSAVIKKYPELLRRLEIDDILELKDVDTPEELIELLRAMT